MEVNMHIPVIFQHLKTFDADDVRFMKVKIWLMHLGENLNGSYFSKESVEKAIPSLANTPILVYIEENKYGEKDFSDHRMELVKEDGTYKIKYMCNAIGVIPESNNAKFEFRICDDGVEREFLTVEGLIWKKWDDPIDIFNRDIIKSQSMEIAEDYTGYWGEDKLFHFENFSFFGACALGKDVLPAMRSSTIELQFNNNDVFSEIQTKMEQFKLLFSSLSENNKQGGNQVEEILKMLESYGLTIEDLQAKGINHEEFSLEELEEKVKAEFVNANSDNHDNNKNDNKPEDKFALTISQLQEEAHRTLSSFGTIIDEYWGFEWPKYSLVDIDTENNKIVAFDYENFYLVGFDYSVEGDKLIVNQDSVRRFKVNYVPMELGEDEPSNVFEVIQSKFSKIKELFEDQKTKLTEKETEYQQLQEKFTALESEYAKVSTEYANKLNAEREAAENKIFEMFAKELTEEEMAEIKANKDNMQLQEIENALFALVGRKKAKFSFSQQDKSKVIDLTRLEPEKKQKTGKSYDELFEKYGK